MRNTMRLTACCLFISLCEQAAIAASPRLSPIGLDSHYTQGARCFLFPLRRGNDNLVYGEIEIGRQATLRLNIDGREWLFPVSGERRFAPRSSLVRRYKVSLTRIALQHDDANIQTTDLSITDPGGSTTTKTFRFECNDVPELTPINEAPIIEVFPTPQMYREQEGFVYLCKLRQGVSGVTVRKAAGGQAVGKLSLGSWGLADVRRGPDGNTWFKLRGRSGPVGWARGDFFSCEDYSPH